MLRVDPKEVSVAKLHGYLLGAVAPRPIAFVSTIDGNGVRNLSPFSFFNAFSVNPPICVFSPARRGKDNTTKHTFENAKEVDEVVINVVSHEIVQQMSLSSTEYPGDVDEFEKSGLTPIDSELVKPARVKESPVQMECKVKSIIELGQKGGAGNLVICEILLMHIDENVLNDQGVIDPHAIDLVGRMGGNWYSRASGNSLFEVEKPLQTIGIGVDRLPMSIRNSCVLTGNNLGQLGNIEALPEKEEVTVTLDDEKIKRIFVAHKSTDPERENQVHQMAKALLDEGDVEGAWKVLMTLEYSQS
ncbi:MAG: flavin reductase family protein [Flavobacteriales bacterium]|nr:flavin reductase family protein [Flavobacteriales bacterium]